VRRFRTPPVILTNHKTNLIQMTTSDSVGHFSFVGLPSGEFEMRVVKQGFAEFRTPQIALNPATGIIAKRDFAGRVRPMKK